MSGSDGMLGMKAGLEEKWTPNTNRRHYFTEKLEDIGGMNSVIWYPSNKGWRNTCSLHLCQSPPHCSAPPGLQLLVAVPEGKWELAEVSTGAAGPEETVTSGVGRGGGQMKGLEMAADETCIPLEYPLRNQEIPGGPFTQDCFPAALMGVNSEICIT